MELLLKGYILQLDFKDEPEEDLVEFVHERIEIDYNGEAIEDVESDDSFENMDAEMELYDTKYVKKMQRKLKRKDIANYLIDCKIDVNRRGKDMEFHYELLEETRKEIKDIRFFREDVALNAEEYEVIHDYDEAYENAFDREYEELEGQTWVDILEDHMAEVRGIIYEHDNYAELNKIVRGIEIPELDDIEFPIDDISVEQEMYSEIELCAKSRFICGKGNAFFESLFKAYKLGGWPCGWKNGKIIVYVPANK